MEVAAELRPGLAVLLAARVESELVQPAATIRRVQAQVRPAALTVVPARTEAGAALAPTEVSAVLVVLVRQTTLSRREVLLVLAVAAGAVLLGQVRVPVAVTAGSMVAVVVETGRDRTLGPAALVEMG